MIDWSFFSMARYLLTADPADGSVIPGRAWDGLLERLAEAGPARRRERSRVLDERLRQVTRLQRS